MPTFSKQFRIDFYGLTCENGNFEEFVNGRTSRGILKQRFQDGAFRIILDVLEDNAAYVCGNFIKVKMADISPKYNVRTYRAASLDLADDEGIPEGNVFLYLKAQKVLFFQVAKLGVSTNQFCEYFERFAGCGQITLNHVLSEEGFRKLAAYNHIAKIQISIKGMETGHLLNRAGSARGVLDKFRELNANNVKLEISKGHRNVGLAIDAARNFLRGMFGALNTHDNEGQLIHVTGRESDNDDMTEIDLLVTRYKRWIEVDINSGRLNSELHTNAKLTELKNLVNPVGRDLNRLFNAQN